MNAGVILVALMQRYLGGLLDPFVTLREVHKLMYFMQFTPRQLAIAEERLRSQGWLSSEVAAAH
ncbi:MAG: hypothetical protein ACREO4_12605 [Lysobacter sp.]